MRLTFLLAGALLTGLPGLATLADAAEAPPALNSVPPATSPAPAAPEMHTFTNDSGASFKARVTAVTSDEVSLIREDGKVFHAKLTLFTKADQDYVRLWAAKNAAATGSDAFEIHATSVKDVVTSTTDPTTGRAISRWTASFRVDVKNLTFVIWPNLHFRYILIRQRANPGELPPNDYTVERTYGTFDLDKLASNDGTSFQTSKMPMQSSALAPNSTYANGAPTAVSDKFKGVWIRVYDDNDNLLEEWASDPAILKEERWVFPANARMRGGPPPPRRGGGGPSASGGARGTPAQPPPPPLSPTQTPEAPPPQY